MRKANYMETKQHATGKKKKKGSTRKSKGKLKNTLRQMIMKTPFEIYRMPQKQFLEGSS